MSWKALSLLNFLGLSQQSCLIECVNLSIHRYRILFGIQHKINNDNTKVVRKEKIELNDVEERWLSQKNNKICCHPPGDSRAVPCLITWSDCGSGISLLRLGHSSRGSCSCDLNWTECPESMTWRTNIQKPGYLSVVSDSTDWLNVDKYTDNYNTLQSEPCIGKSRWLLYLDTILQ